MNNGETFVTQALQARGDTLSFAKDGIGSTDTAVAKQEVASIRYEHESRVVERILTTTAVAFAGLIATAVVFLGFALQSAGC